MAAPEPHSAQTRQKRILPARARRGGPGIGSCDTDLMILDTIKRKFENEPIVPADTPLLLTTDPSLCPANSPSSSSRIIYASERYFDRPDVIKSYRTQEFIQTPSFVSLSHAPPVGGRFRPRESDDQKPDISDAAYEKRHRKYETFERRQRLREKEKLQHEQYKLKERIEQLRGMDGAAFLALPATAFGKPKATNGVASSSQSNGASGQSEGDRRREMVLQVAVSLEERYRVLLPPQKIRKLDNNQREAGAASDAEYLLEEGGVEFEGEKQDEPEVEEEEEEEEEVQEEPEKLPANGSTALKIKINLGKNSRQNSTGRNSKSSAVSASPLPPEPVKSGRRPRGRPRKIRLPLPPPPADEERLEPEPESPSTAPPGFASELNQPGPSNLPDHEETASASDGHALTYSGSLARASSEDMTMSEGGPRFGAYHSVSAPPRIKRPRPADSTLLTAARRTAQARHTHGNRHTRAFGLKVPAIVDELLEYELPQWIVEDIKGEDFFTFQPVFNEPDHAPAPDTVPVPPITTLDPPAESAVALAEVDQEAPAEPQQESDGEDDELDVVGT